MLLSLIKTKCSTKIKELSTGIYLTPMDFDQEIENKIDLHPKLDFINDCFGLCDDFSQVLNKYPQINQCDKRLFIFLTKIDKDMLTKKKQFQYKSWGGYIGDFPIKEEFFSLEKGLDSIYAFHIIEYLD